MLVRNYVQRLRMEAPLRSPPWPEVPAGFTLAAWDPDLLREHAEVKYRSFRHTLDAAIFPNLGVLDGCVQLMRTIAGHDGFVPEATWLMRGPDGPCAERAGADYRSRSRCSIATGSPRSRNDRPRSSLTTTERWRPPVHPTAIVRYALPSRT